MSAHDMNFSDIRLSDLKALPMSANNAITTADAIVAFKHIHNTSLYTVSHGEDKSYPFSPSHTESNVYVAAEIMLQRGQNLEDLLKAAKEHEGNTAAQVLMNSINLREKMACSLVEMIHPRKDPKVHSTSEYAEMLNDIPVVTPLQLGQKIISSTKALLNSSSETCEESNQSLAKAFVGTALYLCPTLVRERRIEKTLKNMQKKHDLM